MKTNFYFPAPLSCANASIPANEYPIGTVDASRGIDLCHNLRPDGSGRALEGVPAPAEFADKIPGGRFVPGGVYEHPDGSSTILVAVGRELFTVRGDETASLGTLDSEPRVAVAVSDGFLVMTSGGPRRLRIEGNAWGEEGGVTEFPALMFERIDMGSITADYGMSPLDGNYDLRSERPTREDSVLIGRELGEIYEQIADKAVASRRFIQPVMARYRLRGRSGETLYTSAPVLVCPESGTQLCRFDMEMTGDRNNLVRLFTAGAESFTLGLRLMQEPNEAWRSLVRRVEILVSPQFHPYLITSACECNFYRGTATNSLRLKAWLPGTTGMLRPGDPGGWVRTCVEAVLTDPDAFMHSVVSASPSAGDSRELRLMPFDGSITSFADERNRLRTMVAAAAKAPEADEATRLLSAPHSFTAEVAATNGDTVAWGNLTAIPFAGFDPGEMITEARVTASGTPAAVSIGFATGGSVARASSLAGLVPTALSTLLAYPDGDARELTFTARDIKARFELTPAAGGRWAIYLHPDCLPLEPVAGSASGYSAPVPSPRLRRFPDHLALAPVTSPLAPEIFTGTGLVSITALAPGRHAGSSLDISRTRFYVFGRAGASLLAVSSGRRAASVSEIDTRCVPGPEAVAVTPEGVAAIASGVPVMFKGNRVTALRPGLTADSIAYDPSRHELWLLSEGADRALVLTPDGATLYTRTMPPVSSTLTLPASLLLLTADNGTLLDSSIADDSIETVMELRSSLCDDCSSTLRRLQLALTGRVESGTVTVQGDNGDTAPGAGYELYRLDLKGQLSHFLTDSFPAGHFHHSTLHITLNSCTPNLVKIHDCYNRRK